jgi:hypothetical protein
MIVRSRFVLVLHLLVVASQATLACSRSDGAATDSSPASIDATAPSPSRTGSCDRVTAMSICSEYSGAYLAQNEAVLSSACAKLSGAFAGAECPNTSVLGSCALSTGEVRKFYASGGAAFDTAKAEKECTGPYRGKWSAFR